MGELRRAPQADSRGEIVGRVGLERNRQHAVRRSAETGLEQIVGTLGEEFGLAGAGPRDDARRACVAQGGPRRRFKIVDAAGTPVLWPSEEHGHGPTGGSGGGGGVRRATIEVRSERNSSGAPAARATESWALRTRTWVLGLPRPKNR